MTTKITTGSLILFNPIPTPRPGDNVIQAKLLFAPAVFLVRLQEDSRPLLSPRKTHALSLQPPSKSLCLLQLFLFITAYTLIKTLINGLYRRDKPNFCLPRTGPPNMVQAFINIGESWSYAGHRHPLPFLSIRRIFSLAYLFPCIVFPYN